MSWLLWMAEGLLRPHDTWCAKAGLGFGVWDGKEEAWSFGRFGLALEAGCGIHT